MEDFRFRIDTIITLEDVNKTVTKLKNRKIPGENEIRNELLKYGGQTLNIEIHQLFEKIYNRMEVHKEWNKSITVPIFFENRSKKEPSNYHGITLLNSIMKLLTSKIAKHISMTISTIEEQQGFRKNRSTTDAKFIIRQIAEKAIKYNKVAYICFVDLTKAFDKVKLEDVVHILIEKGVNEK